MGRGWSFIGWFGQKIEALTLRPWSILRPELLWPRGGRGDEPDPFGLREVALWDLAPVPGLGFWLPVRCCCKVLVDFISVALAFKRGLAPVRAPWKESYLPISCDVIEHRLRSDRAGAIGDVYHFFKTGTIYECCTSRF